MKGEISCPTPLSLRKYMFLKNCPLPCLLGTGSVTMIPATLRLSSTTWHEKISCRTAKQEKVSVYLTKT